MEPTDSPSFLEIITRVRQIADEQYEGQLYNNILTIFNKLNAKEKRIFLRGLLEIREVIIETHDQPIEDQNRSEVRQVLLDLKKIVLIILLMVPFGIMIFSIYTSPINTLGILMHDIGETIKPFI